MIENKKIIEFNKCSLCDKDISIKLLIKKCRECKRKITQDIIKNNNNEDNIIIHKKRGRKPNPNPKEKIIIDKPIYNLYKYINKDETEINIYLKDENKKCLICNELKHYQNFYCINDKKNNKTYLFSKCQDCFKLCYLNKNKINNEINNN